MRKVLVLSVLLALVCGLFPLAAEAAVSQAPVVSQPAPHAVVGRQDLQVRWAPVSGAASYTVVVMEAATWAQLFYQPFINGNSFTVPAATFNKDGAYRLFVSANDATGAGQGVFVEFTVQSAATPAPQPATPVPQPTTPAPRPTTPAPQPAAPVTRPASPAPNLAEYKTGWVVNYNRSEDELEVYHPSLDANRANAPTLNLVVMDGNQYLYAANDRNSAIYPYTNGPVPQYRGKYYRSWWTHGAGSLNLPRGRTLLVGVAVNGTMPDRSQMRPIVVDGIKYYNQEVGVWAFHPYGNYRGATNYGEAGCAPTAAAMVMSTLVDRKYGVETMGGYAVSWGDRTANNGTSQSYFDHLSKFLRKNTRTSSFNEVRAALNRGALVVMNAKAGGYFTGSGHYIVLTGMDGTDRVKVADPNGNNSRRYNGLGPAVWNSARNGLYSVPVSAITADTIGFWIFEP